MMACVLYAALPVVQAAHSRAAHGRVSPVEPAAVVHACTHDGHHHHQPSEPADEPRPAHDHDGCRVCLAMKLARASGMPEFSAPGVVALLPTSLDRLVPVGALPAPVPSLTSAPPRGPPRA
ncbi:hypothetical protein FBT69_03255 [Synechococcales cyanobacterium CNB]|nr:hypothetical protein [Leptolyngbya sp.]MDL1903815.1 hypothetical protein [Synechococcales cyanobacterium CNB]